MSVIRWKLLAGLSLPLLGAQVVPSAHARAQASYELLFTAREGTQLAGITPASDGSVYVVLSAGGPENLGTLARYAADGSVSVLHGFEGPDGAQPMAAIGAAAAGELYGSTSSGGANGSGTIFRLTQDGELSTLHDFTQAQGGGPHAPLSPAADGGWLGVTWGVYDFQCKPNELPPCGSNSYTPGAVFKLSADGALRILYDGVFRPAGGVIEASSGDVFGTRPASALGAGGVYRLRPDGQLTANVASQEAGFNPGGELLEAADGYLYGVSAASSAVPSRPAVFRISAASDRQDSDYHKLAATASAGLAFGTDGNLYGQSGASMFRLTASGIMTWLPRPGALERALSQPTTPLTAAARGSFVIGSATSLFERTQRGGARELHRFDYQDGRFIDKALLARDGQLYGSTSQGGAHGAGTIFRADSAGRLSVLYNFTESREPSHAALRSPLIAAADGFVYCVTNTTRPALLRIDASAATETAVLQELAGPGARSGLVDGSEMLSVDGEGVLYGSIAVSLTDSQVYRFDPRSSELQVLATLSGLGWIMRAACGSFYGWRTTAAGAELFRMTPSGVTSVLHAFSAGADDYTPSSGLAESADGSIYGVASGNDQVSHIVFRWTEAQALEVAYRYATGGPPPSSGAQLAVGKGGEVYMTSRSAVSLNIESDTSVLLPGGELQQLTEHSLGTLVGPLGDIYRIAPIAQHGYEGIRVEPVLLP